MKFMPKKYYDEAVEKWTNDPEWNGTSVKTLQLHAAVAQTLANRPIFKDEVHHLLISPTGFINLTIDLKEKGLNKYLVMARDNFVYPLGGIEWKMYAGEIDYCYQDIFFNIDDNGLNINNINDLLLLKHKALCNKRILQPKDL